MKKMTMDGNAATCYVSYAFSELIFIYPITPSTPMAELADEKSCAQMPNLFDQVPKVVEMQSESGVGGALHGALSCGGLTTTYTSSQGLLLMLPDLYKIAGELLPTVIHVSARALSTHALSIFGDHQDVMACRQTGFAMLCSANVQESMDLALVAHLATLKSQVPFLHFFDGFRTSHETVKIDRIEYDEMRSLLSQKDVENFRSRALNPNSPVQRGTAQNPDIYFQNREASNPYYLALPYTVQSVMDEVEKITGRQYHLFDYFGAEDAEDVLVIMGSGGDTAEETVKTLNADGQKTGVIKIRLYRPFHTPCFLAQLPKTCKNIAVLDRTKEAGATGEPLYLDVCAALKKSNFSYVNVVGGRYGLGMKEFTPTDCYAVFENLRATSPKNAFTVGICDDVTHTSIHASKPIKIEYPDRVSCKFYGLGSDGTVGANKNSVKIIGDYTPLFVQGYFVYDSRKSGGITVSHLRFGKEPIHSPYLIGDADFIACHNPSYLTRYDMLSDCKQNGVFLLNCPWETEEELEKNLPVQVKRQIAEKGLSFYTVNATKLADETGLKGKTSTVMQTAFFLLNEKIMPFALAEEKLKEEIAKKFARKGEKVLQSNFDAIERTKSRVRKIEYPSDWISTQKGAPMLPRPKDEYFAKFIHPILRMQGDTLPVSAFSPDGSVPTGTTKLEKHGVPYTMPKWIKENCIQCNQCSFVCPHACIRPVLLEKEVSLPDGFSVLPAMGLPEYNFKIQVSPHDCMGCSVCANTCPTQEKALVMRPATELMPTEGENWEFAQNHPYTPPDNFKRTTVKGSQFYPPLFEFSYACSGCGETSYIKVLTQLFGEKLIIANATGCSSIYGGSAPTCPYTVNKDGKGPAWANSLFEDNAEFGLGMRLAYNFRKDAMKKDLSVWLIGGDGWAYDIGFGGLDHVLALGEKVRVLVLDSEVYSNTGGQTSKSTPLGAVARFSATGKRRKKKNLGLMAMTYSNVYVAQVSMGANKQQLLTALNEAENFDGPAIILAYSPCIAHGMDMSRCMEEEKLAVDCGYWTLYRYNPALRTENKNPFLLDSKPPTANFQEFLAGENRFSSLKKTAPEHAELLFKELEEESKELYAFYQKLAQGLGI